MHEVTLYDREAEPGHSVKVPETGRPVKLTASRLAEVGEIQAGLRDLGARLERLVEEEEHGWVPGTPQTPRTHRVEPLAALAGQVFDGVEMLERIYS